MSTSASEPEQTEIVAVPRVIDETWLSSLFPNKDQNKIKEWVGKLHANEFETFDDLALLDSSGWDSLDIPLAIKSGVKLFMSNWVASIYHDTVNTAAQPPKPLPLINQIDIVVMDISGSMKSRSHLDADKTREDVSKILFHSLMDKLVSLELPHAVGLLAFGERLTPIAITREYERFHDELGRLDAREGRTKLFDAIQSAGEMIETFVAANSASIDATGCRKRVFVLTDGEDNASVLQPWQVAQYLQQRHISLDAIPLAGSNTVLQVLAAASGGLCFEAKSEQQAMDLFENEATLHISYREVVNDVIVVQQVTDATGFAAMLTAVQKSNATPAVEVKVAVAKTVFAPVLSSMAAMSLSEEAASSGNGSSSVVAGSNSVGRAVVKRVLQEYKTYMNGSAEYLLLSPFLEVFINADDVSRWKVLLKNLPDPYVGGTWLLTVDFPASYPFAPPKVKFITPLYHCNVSSAGTVCLDILKNTWSPALTIFRALQAVQEMLLQPNADDPLDAFKAQVYRDNKEEYMAQARQYTQQHAAASVEEVKALYQLE